MQRIILKDVLSSGENLDALGASMAARTIVLDCSGVDALSAEQISCLLSPLPEDWDVTDLKDVVDVVTVSDDVATAIERAINDRLLDAEHASEPRPALDSVEPSRSQQAPGSATCSTRALAQASEARRSAHKGARLAPETSGKAGVSRGSATSARSSGLSRAVTTSSVEQAMDTFDAVHRNHATWEGWETSRGQAVAIVRRERSYPLQEIVRMAGDEYVSNADRARRIVEDLGFVTRIIASRGLGRLDDGDPDSARALLEVFYPDAAVRNACLGLLADAVEAAHAKNPASWEITLDRGYVMLNVGSTYVVSLSAAFFDANLDLTVLGLDGRSQLEEYGESMKRDRPYREAPDSESWKFSAFRAAAFAPIVRPALTQTARTIASRSEKATRYWKSHSTGMVEYLAGAVGRVLNQPAYVGSEDWTARKTKTARPSRPKR